MSVERPRALERRSEQATGHAQARVAGSLFRAGATTTRGPWRPRVAAQTHRGSLERCCPSRRARGNPGLRSLQRAGPAGRRSHFPRLRRPPGADQATVYDAARARGARIRMSPLAYGLVSWALLDVGFVLGMAYAGSRTAETQPRERPRAAGVCTFDRHPRTRRERRGYQGRLRTHSDWPTRSPRVLARCSRQGRRPGMAGVCRSRAVRPVSRREPRLRARGRQRSRGQLFH
jgi:hypothetical protein